MVDFFSLWSPLTTTNTADYNNILQGRMPGKERTHPCEDCKDAESSASVRGRQLCRYVGLGAFERPLIQVSIETVSRDTSALRSFGA